MATTRRDFLVNGLRVTAAAPLLLRPARALAGGGGGERVLVVVQLTGGNDGLATVVPARQDAYYRLRPTLAKRRSELRALDDEHGLHPALGELAEAWAEGELAVVQGVGTPRPERSHFRSLELWHTGEVEEPASGRREVGWLGRLADQLAERDPTSLAAVHVGDEDLPLSLWGRSFRAPTVRDPAGFRLAPAPREYERARDELLGLRDGDARLAFLREAARGAYAAARRMEELAGRSTAVAYPRTELAQRLALVARLVAGGFGARVFQVARGGFDTHARQAAVHDALLAELAGALGAFRRDLALHGAAERTAVLVFSEFGRRAEENGSRGTDHGAGAPAFVLGARVRGGLHGEPPRLDALVDGDVPATTDFRRLHASLERDWMGLRPSTGLAPLALFG